MTAAKTKDVVKAEQKSTAVASFDYAADAETFKDELGARDLAMPFLTIIQGNSPQVKKTHAKYVEGALPGMIFNTITQRITAGDKGVWIVPVMYERCFIEWIPKDDGGGFVAKHSAADGERATIHRNDKKKPIISVGSPVGTPGHELVETASHVVLDVTDGRIEPAMLGMASTQLKKSRDWNYNLSQRTVDLNGKIVKPARFFFVYRLCTVGESGGGYDWDGWKIIAEGDIRTLPGGDGVYAAAKKLRSDLTTGVSVVDYSKSAGGPVEDMPF